MQKHRRKQETATSSMCRAGGNQGISNAHTPNRKATTGTVPPHHKEDTKRRTTATHAKKYTTQFIYSSASPCRTPSDSTAHPETPTPGSAWHRASPAPQASASSGPSPNDSSASAPPALPHPASTHTASAAGCSWRAYADTTARAPR